LHAGLWHEFAGSHMRGIALEQHIHVGAFTSGVFGQHIEDGARTKLQHAGKAPLRIADRWDLSWESVAVLQRVPLGNSTCVGAAGVT